MLSDEMMNLDRKYALVLPCYSSTDPPTVSTIQNLVECGYKVVVFSREFKFDSYDSVVAYTGRQFLSFKRIHMLQRILIWVSAFWTLRKILKKYDPAISVAFMHSQVAMISFFKKYKFIACIYDIPSLAFAGKIDKLFITAGLKNLHKAELVWCSDTFKAEITKQDAHLETLPLVCHNCPPVNYLGERTPDDIRWLQNKVSDLGAIKTAQPYLIMTRAGAVGRYGGIEETLVALKELPDNYIFLLMGRPTAAFKIVLNDLIAENKLERRVFLIENPDELMWKKVLLGSDAGHLIHIRPSSISDAVAYDLNSSLSNNRLFQYMAASIPILSYNDKRLDMIHNEVECFKVVDVNADIAASIKRLWLELGNEANLRIRMGMNGRDAHLKKYNWEVQFAPIQSALQLYR